MQTRNMISDNMGAVTTEGKLEPGWEIGYVDNVDFSAGKEIAAERIITRRVKNLPNITKEQRGKFHMQHMFAVARQDHWVRTGQDLLSENK